MNDRELHELLTRVEARPASQGFTARTLQRLEDQGGQKLWPRIAAIAVACLLVAAVAIPVGLFWDDRALKADAQAELKALRTEHQHLRSRLTSLRQQTAGQSPILYLGGTDSADYVLDLRQLNKPEPRQGLSAPPIRNAVF